VFEAETGFEEPKDFLAVLEPGKKNSVCAIAIVTAMD
jgi:hypothetical protein